MSAPVPHIPTPGFRIGARFEGGPLHRFSVPPPHADRERASLRPDQAALRDGRTLYRSTVIDPEGSPRLLVSGVNQAKIGGRITRGAWRGMPIYTLTLEERATCPRSCHEWATCYGNGMHLARRHRHGPELEWLLGAELEAKAERHPDGFAVRLHVLGDFYSVRYAARWAVWLRALPALHVFGFTAWPDSSPIAQTIERMNGRFPDRCAIRFSRRSPSGQGWEATTIWREAEAQRVPEGLVCPAQTGRTDCCGTCGLCWAAPMGGTPIVFVGHGRRKRAGAAT